MWIPYWINVIDSLGSVLSWFVFLIGAAFVLAGCIFVITSEDEPYCEPPKSHRAAKKICLILLWIEIPLALITCFIPSKEVMYQMAGFGAAQTVIQSPTANKAVQLANEYLDKQLSLIKGEKEPKK